MEILAQVFKLYGQILSVVPGCLLQKGPMGLCESYAHDYHTDGDSAHGVCVADVLEYNLSLS